MLFAPVDGELPIRLVVGLGNPGPAYAATRHNVGFLILDRLLAQAGEAWTSEKRWEARVGRIGDVRFLKPQTFMNLSGRAVAKAVNFHRFDPGQILAVHDDISLPLGRLRFRAGGSAGGHNGIRSLIAELGGDAFGRLKVGIDGVRGREDLADYVLAPFTAAEAEILEKTLQDSVTALEYALANGLGAAMNRFNPDPAAKRPGPAGPSRAKQGKVLPPADHGSRPEPEPQSDT